MFFFLMSFCFLIKILRKTRVGRGEEGGPNLAKCPQTFSMPLRGLLKERWSRFLPPSKVPFPQCGSVPRKFGTFFFFNQWGNRREELRRGGRQTQTKIETGQVTMGDTGRESRKL